jgi:hypothetical protein
LGGKLLRRELGDPYIDLLFDLYNGRVKAELTARGNLYQRNLEFSRRLNRGN